MEHHVQHGHIGAGAQLQVVRGVFGNFSAARIENDERGALHGFLLQLGARDGVAGGRIGPDDEDAIGEFEVGNGVGSRAGPEGALHPQSRRRVADAGASVYVVGTKTGAYHLLHQVVLLIGTTAAADAGNGVAAVFPFDFGETFSQIIIHLVPGNRFQLPVFANHGMTQAVGVFVKCKGIAPFQTGVAGIDFGVVGRLYAQHFVAADFHFQVAAHAAVGTHRAHFFLRPYRFGLVNIADGGGRTGLRTGAARHAVGIEKRGVHAFDDLAVEAAIGHAEHQLSLHLVAGAHTAVAQNALRHIGGHVRVTEVFAAVEMVFPFRVTHFANAHLSGHVLQFAIAVHFAGQAVQRVIGQHQFDDVAAQLLHALRIGVDHQPFLDGRMTGGNGFESAVAGPGYFHAANPAGAERLQIGRVAEGGYIFFAFVPLEKGEDGFAFADVKSFAVDVSDFGSSNGFFGWEKCHHGQKFFKS